MHTVLIICALLAVWAGAAAASTRPTRLPRARRVCTPQICREVTTMPHSPITVLLPSRKVAVPLYVWYKRGHTEKPRRLAIIIPAALVRASDYSKLAARLSRRGFTVAIPMYAARNRSVDIIQRRIDETRAAGHACPRFGVFATARLINSVAGFVRRHMPAVSLHDITLIGHSFGGAAAAFALMGTCARPATSQLEQLSLDATCEGYVQTPLFSINVLVTYESSFPRLGRVPSDLLIVQITSSLFDLVQAEVPVQLTEDIPDAAKVTQNFSEIASGAERVLEVRMRGGTNHLGPINYVPETRHSGALCGLPRPPPEDAFVSTRKTQNAVIASIADIVTTAVKSFSGGIQSVKKARSEFEKIKFVKRATFAA